MCKVASEGFEETRKILLIVEGSLDRQYIIVSIL